MLSEKEIKEIGEIKNGIPLADNHILRFETEEDVKILSPFPNTANSLISYCLNSHELFFPRISLYHVLCLQTV